MEESLIPEGYENKPLSERLLPGLKGELKALRHFSGTLPPCRFLVFAQGRSGSTLLTSSLDSHPHVRCLDEILRQPRLRPIAFAENLARSANTIGFGFHVKPYQIAKWQRTVQLQFFLKNMSHRGWKIVYLYRENVFNQAISNVFADASGKYHFTQKERPPRSIHVDISYLFRLMRWRVLVRHNEYAALNGIPHLGLQYERDLLNPITRDATMETVQNYVGVEPSPLRSSLRKSVDRPLTEIISNYDEVATALRGTEFERWLPDAPSTVAGGDRAS